MSQVAVTIEGMSCQHCVNRVKKAIDALPGVKSSEVTVGKALVELDEGVANRDQVIAAVVQAGYVVK